MTTKASPAKVSLLLFAALHLAHLCHAERPSEKILDDLMVPLPKERGDGQSTLALRPAGAFQAVSQQNLSSSMEGEPSSKKVTLSMLQEKEHLGQVNAHNYGEPEEISGDSKPVDKEAEDRIETAEKDAFHPNEDVEGDKLTKRYEVKDDKDIEPTANTEKAWTTMAAEQKYSGVDTKKIEAESDLPDGSKKISETMGDADLHIAGDLNVSHYYDKIRDRLKRQEKMLTTNNFSIGDYRAKGEEALNKNKDYHEELKSYVQGLYRMASGTQKLTRDTYVRHAGIATNLYNTVKDAKDYYKKDGDGIKATLLKENAGYHLNAKHKKTMKDFKDNHPDEDEAGGDKTPEVAERDEEAGGDREDEDPDPTTQKASGQSTSPATSNAIVPYKPPEERPGTMEHTALHHGSGGGDTDSNTEKDVID
jgi:hypothetical protein